MSEVKKWKKGIIPLMVGLMLVLGMALSVQAEEPVKILWWSHWANEPSKRQVFERIKADYMLAHPNVKIELVWWDKIPLRDAYRTLMMAGGPGAPDIVTDPEYEAIPQLKAGWFLELGKDFPWENYYPGVKEQGAKYVGVKGYYKYNIGREVNMIFYNPEIFEKIGVPIPANYTFTQNEFLEAVRKGSAAGYAGCANAIGNRPYPACFIVEWELVNRMGVKEALPILGGQVSWDTPEVRQVLNWTVQLRDAGFWPKTFATMTIDEFHVYFHTQRKAMTLWIPSWYTGRAFKPESQGGQSPDFHFGMLRYPTMNGAKGAGRLSGSFESGYMISSATKHPEVARDILAFAAQSKYGALWELLTDIPSTIKYTAKDMPKDVPPSKWGWYHEEINKVYGGLPVDVVSPQQLRSGDFQDAYRSIINEGLPEGLVTVEEAIKRLDAAEKK